MDALVEENSGSVTAASVSRQVLSLAGDALCIAATALRLAVLPSTADEPKEGPVTPGLLPEVSLAEVELHDTAQDCWIVVCDLVYDVTTFLHEHPGGEDVILEYAGRDASLAFRSVNHSPAAWRSLERHIVGRLPAKERIFRQLPGKQAYNASREQPVPARQVSI